MALTATEYIQHLRTKPHHVRERIALGTAFGITLVVAFVWLLTLSATGAFSLATPASTAATPLLTELTPTAAASEDTGTNFSQLLGAVGAAGSSTSAPTLTVEDQGASSTLDRETQPSDATTISF